MHCEARARFSVFTELFQVALHSKAPIDTGSSSFACEACGSASSIYLLIPRAPASLLRCINEASAGWWGGENGDLSSHSSAFWLTQLWHDQSAQTCGLVVEVHLLFGSNSTCLVPRTVVRTGSYNCWMRLFNPQKGTERGKEPN
jgi:hypothetical protein